MSIFLLIICFALVFLTGNWCGRLEETHLGAAWLFGLAGFLVAMGGVGLCVGYLP